MWPYYSPYAYSFYNPYGFYGFNPYYSFNGWGRGFYWP